jgi:hypothetical protein
MKAPADTKTADLLPAHDLAGERPVAPSKGKKRLDAMRARRGLKGLTVNLPIELVEEFHERRKSRNHTANEAIEKLIRTQYLRKR